MILCAFILEKNQENLAIRGAIQGYIFGYTGLNGEASPERGAFFALAVYLKGTEIYCSSMIKGRPTTPQTKERAAKSMY